MNFVMLLAVMLGAYLLGSVNFSILLFRVRGMGDPRDHFSGNPGATNVRRQMGLKRALLVLGLDLLRAGAASLIAQTLFGAAWIPWVGLALITGNMKPVFHGFRGGKGVAAYLGFHLFWTPLAALLAAAAWGAVFAATRHSFLGSHALVALLALATARHIHWVPWGLIPVAVTAGLILWAHRRNWRALKQPANQ
jgi:glycerol-3-phosphate acyltransferase PlsY